MYAHVYCKDMQKNPNFIIYNVKGTAKTDFFAFSRKKLLVLSLFISKNCIFAPNFSGADLDLTAG